MERPIADFKRAVVAQRQHLNNKMPHGRRIVATTWRPNWPERPTPTIGMTETPAIIPSKPNTLYLLDYLALNPAGMIGRRAACLRYPSQLQNPRLGTRRIQRNQLPPTQDDDLRGRRAARSKL
jgi:hypothetical protein